MNVLEFSALVATGSFTAGLLGSMTGLGGGVVIVPMLTLLFHVDFRYAIGASLIAVIATSSGAASAYVREGYSNIRVGMFLEIATSIGALIGAAIAAKIPTSALAVTFGIVLIYSAIQAIRAKPTDATRTTRIDPLAEKLRVNSTYPTLYGLTSYKVQGLRLGFVLMIGAGALSALLGIGSGAMKVLAMDQVMKLPFKVSTTTSNFMIGVTAAASAGIYLNRGYIDPGIAMPVMLGVLAGSVLGAKLLVHANVNVLRRVFAVAILAIAVEMMYGGVVGKI